MYLAKKYLNLQKVRYPNINYVLDIDEEMDEIIVPKMILQPLIENAVFHGCSPALELHNTITLSTVTTDQQCTILIHDNGIGIPPDKLSELKQLNNMAEIPSDSIGFSNVVFRMYLTYGHRFHFDIDSIPDKGTCIQLIFPTTGTTP